QRNNKDFGRLNAPYDSRALGPEAIGTQKIYCQSRCIYATILLRANTRSLFDTVNFHFSGDERTNPLWVKGFHVPPRPGTGPGQARNAVKRKPLNISVCNR